MFASVRLPASSSREGSLYVPKTVVINTIDHTYVPKVVDGRTVQVTVQKGDESASQTQVFSELKAGDVILKTASEDLIDQAVVKTQLVSQ